MYDLLNSGNSDDIEQSSISFVYCESFQMGFFVQLCSRWQDFNWHSALRGSSASEPLVTNCCLWLFAVLVLSAVQKWWTSKCNYNSCYHRHLYKPGAQRVLESVALLSTCFHLVLSYAEYLSSCRLVLYQPMILSSYSLCCYHICYFHP